MTVKRRRKVYVSKAARQELSSIFQGAAIGQPIRLDDWRWMVTGRELEDWFKTHAYRKIVNEVGKQFKMTEDQMVWEDENGHTTIHYYLAFSLAIYIDPHFESYMAVINDAQQADMWNTLVTITTLYIEEGEQSVLRFWNAVTTAPNDEYVN